MTVDKRINYVGGGDLYQGGSGVAGSAEAPKPSRKTYTSKNINSKPVTGADYKRSRKQFIDKFNQDRTAALGRKYKPIGLDRFGSSNQLGAKGGIGNLFKGLLSMAVPGAGFLFNKGKQGIAGMNNVLNNFTRNMRKGFDTQEEYEIDRQKKIDNNTIRTLENTIQKKYLDKDRSLDETQLDEKLAALKQKLGIMENVKDDIKTISIANPEIFDNSVIKQVPQNPSELYINSTPFTNNPVGGLDQYAKEMEALTKRGEDYYFPDELGGTLQDFYLNKNPLLGDLLDLSEKDEFGPNPFLPLEPTNFNTDQSGITNSDVASEFRDMIMQTGMNETQKKLIDNAAGMYGQINDGAKLNQTTQQEIFKTIKDFDTKAKDKIFGIFGGQEADPLTEEEYKNYLISQGYI